MKSVPHSAGLRLHEFGLGHVFTEMLGGLLKSIVSYLSVSLGFAPYFPRTTTIYSTAVHINEAKFR